MGNSRIAFSAVTAVLFFVSGCTVQPLYSEKLASQFENNVEVGTVQSRVSQQVRNELLFLLNGNGAQAANPKYKADITVSSSASNALSVATVDGSDNSVTTVTLEGSLSLSSSASGDILKKYKRTKVGSLDRSSQSFANSRALIDLENRLAKQLAEEFRILILRETTRQ